MIVRLMLYNWFCLAFQMLIILSLDLQLITEVSLPNVLFSPPDKWFAGTKS